MPQSFDTMPADQTNLERGSVKPRYPLDDYLLNSGTQTTAAISQMPPISPVSSPETVDALQNAEKLLKNAQKQIMEVSFNTTLYPVDENTTGCTAHSVNDDDMLYLREIVESKFHESNDLNKLHSRGFTMENRIQLNPKHQYDQIPVKETKDIFNKRLEISAQSSGLSSRQIPKEMPWRDDKSFFEKAPNWFWKDRSAYVDVYPTQVANCQKDDNKSQCGRNSRLTNTGVFEVNIRDHPNLRFQVQTGPKVDIQRGLTVQNVENVHISPDPSSAPIYNNVATFSFRHEPSSSINPLSKGIFESSGETSREKNCQENDKEKQIQLTSYSNTTRLADLENPVTTSKLIDPNLNSRPTSNIGQTVNAKTRVDLDNVSLRSMPSYGSISMDGVTGPLLHNIDIQDGNMDSSLIRATSTGILTTVSQQASSSEVLPKVSVKVKEDFQDGNQKVKRVNIMQEIPEEQKVSRETMPASEDMQEFIKKHRQILHIDPSEMSIRGPGVQKLQYVEVLGPDFETRVQTCGHECTAGNCTIKCERDVEHREKQKLKDALEAIANIEFMKIERRNHGMPSICSQKPQSQTYCSADMDPNVKSYPEPERFRHALEELCSLTQSMTMSDIDKEKLKRLVEQQFPRDIDSEASGISSDMILRENIYNVLGLQSDINTRARKDAIDFFVNSFCPNDRKFNLLSGLSSLFSNLERGSPKPRQRPAGSVYTRSDDESQRADKTKGRNKNIYPGTDSTTKTPDKTLDMPENTYSDTDDQFKRPDCCHTNDVFKKLNKKSSRTHSDADDGSKKHDKQNAKSEKIYSDTDDESEKSDKRTIKLEKTHSDIEDKPKKINKKKIIVDKTAERKTSSNLEHEVSDNRKQPNNKKTIQSVPEPSSNRKKSKSFKGKGKTNYIPNIMGTEPKLLGSCATSKQTKERYSQNFQEEQEYDLENLNLSAPCITDLDAVLNMYSKSIDHIVQGAEKLSQLISVHATPGVLANRDQFLPSGSILTCDTGEVTAKPPNGFEKASLKIVIPLNTTKVQVESDCEQTAECDFSLDITELSQLKAAKSDKNTPTKNIPSKDKNDPSQNEDGAKCPPENGKPDNETNMKESCISALNRWYPQQNANVSECGNDYLPNSDRMNDTSDHITEIACTGNKINDNRRIAPTTRPQSAPSPRMVSKTLPDYVDPALTPNQVLINLQHDSTEDTKFSDKNRKKDLEKSHHKEIRYCMQESCNNPSIFKESSDDKDFEAPSGFQSPFNAYLNLENAYGRHIRPDVGSNFDIRSDQSAGFDPHKYSLFTPEQRNDNTEMNKDLEVDVIKAQYTDQPIETESQVFGQILDAVKHSSKAMKKFVIWLFDGKESGTAGEIVKDLREAAVTPILVDKFLTILRDKDEKTDVCMTTCATKEPSLTLSEWHKIYDVAKFVTILAEKRNDTHDTKLVEIGKDSSNMYKTNDDAIQMDPEVENKESNIYKEDTNEIYDKHKIDGVNVNGIGDKIDLELGFHVNNNLQHSYYCNIDERSIKESCSKAIQYEICDDDRNNIKLNEESLGSTTIECKEPKCPSRNSLRSDRAKKVRLAKEDKSVQTDLDPDPDNTRKFGKPLNNRCVLRNCPSIPQNRPQPIAEDKQDEKSVQTDVRRNVDSVTETEGTSTESFQILPASSPLIEKVDDSNKKEFCNVDTSKSDLPPNKVTLPSKRSMKDCPSCPDATSGLPLHKCPQLKNAESNTEDPEKRSEVSKNSKELVSGTPSKLSKASGNPNETSKQITEPKSTSYDDRPILSGRIAPITDEKEKDSCLGPCRPSVRKITTQNNISQDKRLNQTPIQSTPKESTMRNMDSTANTDRIMTNARPLVSTPTDYSQHGVEKTGGDKEKTSGPPMVEEYDNPNVEAESITMEPTPSVKSQTSSASTYYKNTQKEPFPPEKSTPFVNSDEPKSPTRSATSEGTPAKGSDVPGYRVDTKQQAQTEPCSTSTASAINKLLDQDGILVLQPLNEEDHTFFIVKPTPEEKKLIEEKLSKISKSSTKQTNTLNKSTDNDSPADDETETSCQDDCLRDSDCQAICGKREWVEKPIALSLPTDERVGRKKDQDTQVGAETDNKSVKPDPLVVSTTSVDSDVFCSRDCIEDILCSTVCGIKKPQPKIEQASQCVVERKNAPIKSVPKQEIGAPESEDCRVDCTDDTVCLKICPQIPAGRIAVFECTEGCLDDDTCVHLCPPIIPNQEPAQRAVATNNNITLHTVHTAELANDPLQVCMAEEESLHQELKNAEDAIRAGQTRIHVAREKLEHLKYKHAMDKNPTMTTTKSSETRRPDGTVESEEDVALKVIFEREKYLQAAQREIKDLKKHVIKEKQKAHTLNYNHDASNSVNEHTETPKVKHTHMRPHEISYVPERWKSFYDDSDNRERIHYDEPMDNLREITKNRKSVILPNVVRGIGDIHWAGKGVKTRVRSLEPIVTGNLNKPDSERRYSTFQSTSVLSNVNLMDPAVQEHLAAVAKPTELEEGEESIYSHPIDLARREIQAKENREKEAKKWLKQRYQQKHSQSLSEDARRKFESTSRGMDADLHTPRISNKRPPLSDDRSLKSFKSSDLEPGQFLQVRTPLDKPTKRDADLEPGRYAYMKDRQFSEDENSRSHGESVSMNLCLTREARTCMDAGCVPNIFTPTSKRQRTASSDLSKKHKTRNGAKQEPNDRNKPKNLETDRAFEEFRHKSTSDEAKPSETINDVYESTNQSDYTRNVETSSKNTQRVSSDNEQNCRPPNTPNDSKDTTISREIEETQDFYMSCKNTPNLKGHKLDSTEYTGSIKIANTEENVTYTRATTDSEKVRTQTERNPRETKQCTRPQIIDHFLGKRKLEDMRIDFTDCESNLKRQHKVNGKCYAPKWECQQLYIKSNYKTNTTSGSKRSEVMNSLGQCTLSNNAERFLTTRSCDETNATFGYGSSSKCLEQSSTETYSDGELIPPSSCSYSAGEVKISGRGSTIVGRSFKNSDGMTIFVTKSMLNSGNDASNSPAQSIGEVRGTEVDFTTILSDSADITSDGEQPRCEYYKLRKIT